jgi:hypothetical protein
MCRKCVEWHDFSSALIRCFRLIALFASGRVCLLSRMKYVHDVPLIISCLLGPAALVPNLGKTSDLSGLIANRHHVPVLLSSRAHRFPF